MFIVNFKEQTFDFGPNTHFFIYELVYKALPHYIYEYHLWYSGYVSSVDNLLVGGLIPAKNKKYIFNNLEHH